MLDEQDFEASRRRRWYGIDRVRRQPNVLGYYDFDITEVGYGYHMTDLQATMGLAHLQDLNEVLLRRAALARLYRKRLEGIPGVTLLDDDRPDRSSGYQLFTMHVEKREDFCRMMRTNGVEASVVHVRNDQYTVFGGLRSDLPNLDRFAATHISLPLHGHLGAEDAAYVADCVCEGW
jgi:perosamine synthetase